MRNPKRQETTQLLQKEFRNHLENFYATMKLAPPYHSMEKAIQGLAHAFKTCSPQEQGEVGRDVTLKWRLFEQAFVESGLSRKHRGIILGLVQAQNLKSFSPEHQALLKHVLS